MKIITFTQLHGDIHRELSKYLTPVDRYHLNESFPDIIEYKKPKNIVTNKYHYRVLLLTVSGQPKLCFTEPSGLRREYHLDEATADDVYIVNSELRMEYFPSFKSSFFNHVILNITTLTFNFTEVTMSCLREIGKHNMCDLEFLIIDNCNLTVDITLRDIIDVFPKLTKLKIMSHLVIRPGWICDLQHMQNMKLLQLCVNASTCLNFSTDDLVNFLQRQSPEFECHLYLMNPPSEGNALELLKNRLSEKFEQVPSFDYIRHHRKIAFHFPGCFIFGLDSHSAYYFVYSVDIDKKVQSE